MKRGEVWLAALDPTQGSEIRKTRPCLVISPPEINAHLRTVMVAPMMTGSRPAAFRVPVEFGGLSGLVLAEQSRALDKTRLIKRLGSVSAPVLKDVLKVLRAFYEE